MFSKFVSIFKRNKFKVFFKEELRLPPFIKALKLRYSPADLLQTAISGVEIPFSIIPFLELTGDWVSL